MEESLRELFKTKPTKTDVLDKNTLVIHFDNICVRVNVQERGCCVGKYYKWSLDSEVSENSGKDYKTYRDYVIIESLKNNKDIQVDELIKEYGFNTRCNIAL